MKKIFVFGSLNMDLVINSPYMPQEGETMFGSGFMTNPGGKGAPRPFCGFFPFFFFFSLSLSPSFFFFFGGGGGGRRPSFFFYK